MEQLLLQKIEEQYTQARTLLLRPDSYQKELDAEQVQHFFTFLEYAFQQPINRLLHLEGLLCDSNSLLVAKMYPFGLLQELAKTQLRSLCIQAVKLAECYALLYEEEVNLEPHEV